MTHQWVDTLFKLMMSCLFPGFLVAWFGKMCGHRGVEVAGCVVVAGGAVLAVTWMLATLWLS